MLLTCMELMCFRLLKIRTCLCLPPHQGGWHWWAALCPTWSPQCRGTHKPHWGAPHLHLAQEGNAGPEYLATSTGLQKFVSKG